MAYTNTTVSKIELGELAINLSTNDVLEAWEFLNNESPYDYYDQTEVKLAANSFCNQLENQLKELPIGKIKQYVQNNIDDNGLSWDRCDLPSDLDELPDNNVECFYEVWNRFDYLVVCTMTGSGIGFWEVI